VNVSPGYPRLLSWPQLVVAQFILTIKSRRWTDLIGGALALHAIAFLFATLLDERNSADPMISVGWVNRESYVQRMIVETWTLGLPFLAATWPAFLWRDEGPAQRRYHWSLPADRGWHDLARVAAGAIWIAILTVLVFTVIAAWLPGGRLGMIPARWFFMTLLAAYGLGSIAALTTERPLLWIMGTIALAAFGLALLEFGGVDGVIPRWLYEGRPARVIWLLVAIAGLDRVTRYRTGAPKLTLRRK
jgi:hypothetical protein